jgi:uncharacterized membrane protein YebE (DUF533 family)
LIDFNNIVKGLSSSPSAKGFLGGLAGGAVGGALTSKKGRKGATKMLKYGGMAAVGALAWKAYKQYSDKNSNAEPNANLSTAPAASNAQQPNNQYWNGLESQQFHNLDDSNNNETQGIFVVKAMVAAAMSDGHIDGKEYQNILSKADDMQLSSDDKNLVFSEIANPMSLQQVIQQTTSPELAMEVYTASLLAIDENKAAGQKYLSELSQGLQLPPPLIQAVHSQVQKA